MIIILVGHLVAAFGFQNSRRADDSVDAAVGLQGLGHGGNFETERSHKVTDEDYDEQMDVLLKGTFALNRAVIKAMSKQKQGLVINVGSVSGTRAAPGMAVYGAAKAAVRHLTSSLAAEYAHKGVRFLCLEPGPIKTNLLEPLMFDMLEKKIPLGRLGQPEEVAALVQFLFSDEAAFMTGSTITIDGGAAL